MTQIDLNRKGRINQGDIIQDVEYFEYLIIETGEIRSPKIIFPFVYVLTQDCDLEQDSRIRENNEKSANQDKWLLSVLVAPIYNVEHVYHGTQLESLKWKMTPVQETKTEGNYLRTNQRPRYHYLEFPDDVYITPSVIDFKHYFSLSVKYLVNLKATNYVCTVDDLFREDISHRFAFFLSRIGLPDLGE